MTENTFISPEVSATKFFLRELLLFFIEKRRGVFGDADFDFSVKEFQEFIKGKEFARVMGEDINDKNINAHLKNCKDLNKRDKDNKIIIPQTQILNYTVQGRGNQQRFEINNCQTEYIKNALRDIDIALNIHDWSKDGEQRVTESKETLFSETQDHKLFFHGKTTKGNMSNKERALFESLAATFGDECPYDDLFKKCKKLAGSGNTLSSMHTTATQKKDYINNGIQELKKKLYEISGNPNTIETLTGRKSIYKLIY